MLPVAGLAQRAVPDAEGLALEDVLRLQQPRVGRQVQAVDLGDRLRRLLRALQRGGHHVGDVPALEVLGDPVRHLPAQLGEVVAVTAPVEHTLRVVHLTVAHQVHDGELGGGGRGAAAHAVASAAARAAAGSAAAMRSIAFSSWAVETNQDSKADGGR